METKTEKAAAGPSAKAAMAVKLVHEYLGLLQ